MKYSIIVPVYNVEQYLRECIESVIAQTYSDWELILVDDGSTDSSPSICDEYSEKDSRIKVIHVENGGAYKARVLAKDYIEGEYTIGLDSDDMYTTNCLETLDKQLKTTNADMIVFGRSKYEEDVDKYYHESFGYEDGRWYTREEILERTLILKDHSLGNKVVKSDIYKFTDYINEDYRLSLSLDYLQVVPVICGINRAYAISDNMYIYRMRKGSITHSHKFANIVDNDWINCKLKDYLMQRELYSEKIKFALERSYMDVFISRLYRLGGILPLRKRK